MLVEGFSMYIINVNEKLRKQLIVGNNCGEMTITGNNMSPKNRSQSQKRL